MDLKYYNCKHKHTKIRKRTVGTVIQTGEAVFDAVVQCTNCGKVIKKVTNRTEE